MSDPTDLTPIILQNIQDELANLRTRMDVLEYRMEAGFTAVNDRFDAFEARTRILETELGTWRERLSREQALRERNARKTLELFDVMIKRVKDMDVRVTSLEAT